MFKFQYRKSKISQPALLFRDLLQRRLGCCPKCVRWSILTTLGSWLIYAAIPQSPRMLLLPCILFSCLTLAHMLRHIQLTTKALREFEKEAQARKVQFPHMARREALWIACRAGMAFAAVAVLGRHAALAWGPCKGHHAVPQTVVVGGADLVKAIAERNLEKSLISYCDQQCQNFDCPATNRCETSGKVGIKGKVVCSQNKNSLQWTCQATVKSCPCDCFECAGGQKPIAPFDKGIDLGSNTREQSQMRANADAQQLCGEFCARFVCPTGNCMQNNLALGGIHCTQQTNGSWDCSVTISKCTCKCGGT